MGATLLMKFPPAYFSVLSRGEMSNESAGLELTHTKSISHPQGILLPSQEQSRGRFAGGLFKERPPLKPFLIEM